MSAHRSCENAHSPGSPSARAVGGIRPALGALLAALAVAGSALPQAPGLQPGPQLEREFTELLHHDDPVVRGEAALALASTGDLQHYDAILEVARDPAPQAELRGILAVGYLAAPGAEAFLGEVLTESSRRDRARSVAALAIGLLPEPHDAAAIDAYLRRVQGASYRQHRDTLAALLLGLAKTAHPSRVAAVYALLEDAANREPVLRRLAIEVLARVPGSMTLEQADRLLHSDQVVERLGVLIALRQGIAEPSAACLTEVADLARHDRDSQVRAAALRLLTKKRHLAALDIVPHALRSGEPDEAAAGVEAALHLGGGALRLATEDYILAARSPAAQARMLGVYGTSRSTPFLDGCLRLAASDETDERVRIAATALSARCGDPRIAPVARALFVAARTPDDLLVLAGALRQLDALDTVVGGIYPPGSPNESRIWPQRLRALLAVEYPRALSLLEDSLRRNRKNAGRQAELLRAFRSAALPSLTAAETLRAAGPSVLLDLLL